MIIEHKKTTRGFSYRQFKDRYGKDCSIQKSSLATEDAIWFGIDDANHQVMASKAFQYGIDTIETTGWVQYPIPKDFLLSTRMHLTRDQVKNIIPILHHFVETGELPEYEDFEYDN